MVYSFSPNPIHQRKMDWCKMYHQMVLRFYPDRIQDLRLTEVLFVSFNQNSLRKKVSKATICSTLGHRESFSSGYSCSLKRVVDLAAFLVGLPWKKYVGLPLGHQFTHSLNITKPISGPWQMQHLDKCIVANIIAENASSLRFNPYLFGILPDGMWIALYIPKGRLFCGCLGKKGIFFVSFCKFLFCSYQHLNLRALNFSVLEARKLVQLAKSETDAIQALLGWFFCSTIMVRSWLWLTTLM